MSFSNAIFKNILIPLNIIKNKKIYLHLFYKEKVKTHSFIDLKHLIKLTLFFFAFIFNKVFDISRF